MFLGLTEEPVRSDGELILLMDLRRLEFLIGKHTWSGYLDDHFSVVQALVAGIAGLCQLHVGHGKLLRAASFDCPCKGIERRLGDGRSEAGGVESVVLGDGVCDARERIAQFPEFVAGVAPILPVSGVVKLDVTRLYCHGHQVTHARVIVGLCARRGGSRWYRLCERARRHAHCQ
jgi:hypothetical protein